MATTTINTSKAGSVTVNLKNIDNIPLSIIVNEVSGETKTAQDLTQYGFDLRLMLDDSEKKVYSIAQGATTSTYLAKTGAGTTVLNMQAMWEDIQSIAAANDTYRLICQVTRPDTTRFVYLIFTINASKY